MAEAIFSALLGDVVSRAISLLIGHYTSGKESTEGNLQWISHLLIRIHSVVEEAKGRQISNHGTLRWLSELIDGEYQGCYLLDSIGYGGQEEADELCDGDKVVPPQVSTLSLFNPAKRVRVDGGTKRRSNKFSWHHDVGADEIDRVLERLQGMSHDLREFIMLLQNCKPIRRPLASSIFREGQMFGRHVEKERIINFLLHEGEQSAAGELGVLPIVGASGVGKTTLVQHACDDYRVRNHFAVIILCSSLCTYDVKNNQRTLTRTLIDPLEFVKGNSSRDKRCLFVFDENVDMHRKHILEEFLQILRGCCKEESKVIITTNNRRVANIIGTVEPIILRVLRHAEYWFFFKAHAFPGRDTEDNPSLISAAMGIARKLNGSFFDAKIIGGVLRDRPDPNLWCKILRSSIGGMGPMGDCIIYISDLAHNLLPGHVDMRTVTCSKDPFPSQTAEVPWLKDLCGAVPHDSLTACWADEGRYTNVLLCKSVMPFRSNRYYVARCTCTCSSTIGPTNSCSELVLSIVRDM